MSYSKLVQFGTVELPVYEPETEAGTAPTEAGILRTAGSFYDEYGEDVAPPDLPYEMRFTAGVSETTEAAMRASLAELRGLRGRRKRLWRQHLDDDDSEWCWARLLRLEERRTAYDVYWQVVTLVFLVLTEWRGTWHGDSWYLDAGEELDTGLYLDQSELHTLDGSPKSITLTNASADGGAYVHDVTLTITAGSANITALDIYNSTTDCRLTFSGVIATTKALVIDCGNMLVLNDGTSAYNDFALSWSYHANSYWFELAPGSNSITVTYTGGSTDSTIEFEYAEGWE